MRKTSYFKTTSFYADQLNFKDTEEEFLLSIQLEEYQGGSNILIQSNLHIYQNMHILLIIYTLTHSLTYFEMNNK